MSERRAARSQTDTKNRRGALHAPAAKKKND
jgi:hypothetical protein